jgi:hypothetical protein
MDVDPSLGLGMNPSVRNAATGEYKCVRAVLVENGQLEILVKRGGRNRVPHLRNICAAAGSNLIWIKLVCRLATTLMQTARICWLSRARNTRRMQLVQWRRRSGYDW